MAASSSASVVAAQDGLQVLQVAAPVGLVVVAGRIVDAGLGPAPRASG